MKSIKVPNTYDVSLSGGPSTDLTDLPSSSKVAVLPSTLANIKPKLMVKVGDRVARGQAVAYDKLIPDAHMVAPSAGVVSAIHYGPKRRLDEIVIDVEGDDVVSFDAHTQESLSSLSETDLKGQLLKGGLWPFFTALPFQGMPSANQRPAAIYVAIDDDEPFTPHSSVLLKGRQELFRLGLNALSKLTDKVVVSAALGNEIAGTVLSDVVDVLVEGAYPANQPATVVYANKKDSSHNRAWTIKCQNVLALAEFLTTGIYPNQRIISMGGPKVTSPQHYRVSVGAAIRDIVKDRYSNDSGVRFVCGGVMTGRNGALDSFLGYGEDAINILQDELESEFMNFVGLGFNKPTFGRAYLGGVKTQEWAHHTGVNGSERDCVACGYCADVCSVGILPQFLMRNVVSDDVDDALAHGLLDCSECGNFAPLYVHLKLN